MTDFWQGVTLTIAVMAVSIIVAALVSYRRQERKRQQAVDAIMAKVASDSSVANLKAAFDSWPGDSKGVLHHPAPLKRKDTH